MKKLKECTQSMIEAVRDTEEYREYHAQLEAIKQDEVLYNRMNDYRRKIFWIQVNGDEQKHGVVADLQMEFAEVLANVQVQAFLTADRKLGKLIRRVTNTIMDSADMDIDFLEG